MSVLRRLSFVVLAIAMAGHSAVAQPDSQSIYEQALASESRLDGDAARDAGRNPAAVLKFLGITPGMTVLDMFSGGGYYSEILANVVGESGSVVAHSNTAYLNFVGEEFINRYKAGRLPNVDILMAENNKLRLDENQFDAIFMGLAYHDIYWVNPESGWHELDGDKFRAELLKSLKPGGILGITDHYADPDASRSEATGLHRIAKSIVITDLETAGFELVEESDVLRNPDDDHNKSVFAEGIRGNTDRFVLKFRKPE
jgi:predicted methyltransferase